MMRLRLFQQAAKRSLPVLASITAQAFFCTYLGNSRQAFALQKEQPATNKLPVPLVRKTPG